MHESSLARKVLGIVLDRVPDNRKILRVAGRIADAEDLSPDALAFHFHAHARETPAADADVAFECIPVTATCDTCGAEYPPDHGVTLCPDCGDTHARLSATPGVWVDSIEVA